MESYKEYKVYEWFYNILNKYTYKFLFKYRDVDVWVYLF